MYPLKTVRLCSTIAIGLGFLALLGWGLGLPLLASLGPDKIPMAPSTALLFVLYGTSVLLRARKPLSPRANRVGAAINSAGAIVALLLLALSFLGIPATSERLGFAVVDTVGEASVGHMSPVTAICFLLASASFLGSLPPKSAYWRDEAAWWSACILMGASSGLVLAYLFGRPLFYSGCFIPPAATTSIAFVALGTALLALVGRKSGPPDRRTGPPARVPFPLVLVFALLAAGIVTVGGDYFRGETRRYRAEEERQLATVADLKVRDLTQWRAERLSDGTVFLGNATFSALVRRLFDKPQDAAVQGQLRAWLPKTGTHHPYDQVCLLDAQGAVRLSVPEGQASVSSVIARRVPEVLRSGAVAFEDFYRKEHDERVYLSVLVPILDGQGQALGMLALTIDPETYLYPFISRWPTPAQTAETLLVRRDGSDAVFLNDLKFQKHTALTLRIPLARSDVAGVKAVLGQRGIVEGRDYRGVPVVAALLPVPDSPWFLVARVDAAEVDAPLRERLWVMLVLLGGMLAAAAGGVGIVWRQQRVRDLRARYEAERERAWLHEVVARSLDEVYVLDPETLRLRFVNLGGCRNIGYTQEEFAGLTFPEIEPHFTVGIFRALLEPLRGVERPMHAYETVHRRKDGSEYPVEVHIQLVDSEAGPVFLATANDVSEPRRAQQRLRDSELRYRRLFESAKDGILILDADTGMVVDVNPFLIELLGYSRETFLGKAIWELGCFKDVVANQANFAELQRAEYIRYEDKPLETSDGRRIDVEFVSNVYSVDHKNVVQVVQCNIRDISERKRAERRIRHLNRVYRMTSEINQLIVRAGDQAALFAEACRIAVGTGGYRMAWVGLVDATANSLRPVASAGVTDGYLETVQIDLDHGPRSAGPAGAAVREGRRNVCNDIEHDPRMAAWRDGALARGYRAAAGFPLKMKGVAVGAFTVYASETEFFDDEELSMLDEIASDLSFSMEMGRLEEMRNQLATAIEQSPVSVYITDADGRIQYLNPAFTQITGYSSEEALGANPRMLKSGRQEEALYQELWATISSGESWHGELVNRRKDRTLYTQELTIAPVRDSGGIVTHYAAIGEDVTERKQAEQALRESEARFRSLFHSDLLGIFVADAETIRESNDELLRIIGHSREDLEAARISLRDMTPPDWAEADAKALGELGTLGRCAPFEKEWFRKDGSRVPVFLGATTFTKDPLRFLCFALDLSAGKRMEGSLRASEERFRAVADSANEGIVTATMDGTIVGWNRGAERIFGYPATESVGQPLLMLIPEGQREAHLAGVDRFRSGGESHLIGRVVQSSALRKDGSELPVELSLATWETAEGQFVTAMVRDLTERKRLEGQLFQSQKLEAIGQLAGGVAHDFNNLLGVIMGYGELAQSQIAPDHPARARIGQVLKAAERAASLTRQLLAFSRKQILQPKALDLNETISNTHKMLGRLIGEDIEVVVCPSLGLGTIMADHGQMEQVILNLAVNARDAMPTGGTLTLETANVDFDADYAAAHPPATPGRHVMLAVSDTGIGMDQETQQRMFEPFFTTKAEGKGTGLGLATVYGIVKQSGGFIWVYSELGRGTTFKLYLPRVDESSMTLSTGVVPDAPRGQETILLVEDSEPLREVTQAMLEQHGYTVLLAASGEDALALVRERDGPIHLLLTDVVMPKLGGRDLAKALLVLRPETKVLYMSGYTDGALSQHGILEEGVRLLEKPFTGDKLAWAVREAIDIDPPPKKIDERAR